ncbi:MAG: phosphoribosylformylglycinamidine cyclo-ligase [Melioribacteraceae bacterium]|nr:MAG: phosphoribosylformylglycinamidine cyclo-ligase [Melioribacteraceae bacterium]
MDSTYKNAGVDIEAGDDMVQRIKGHVKSTFNSGVLSGIGHFGAFFQPDFSKYKEPVMVSSVDGVGTKLMVAVKMDKHDTVGQCLVNHCVNDIAVCGAQPLFFMDYLAFGKLYPDKAEQIIKGFSIACAENGVALIGGETAEMPGMYAKEDYDISGTIVGIVDKSKIIDGKKVKSGDVIIGFKSTGLHTNGYSLARKVLFDKYSVTDTPDGLDKSIGEALLAVHKSYLPVINVLKNEIDIHAFSHITGGGMIGNTKRVLPEGLSLNINWNAWELPAIFKLIAETGKISHEEMRKVFNLGIGLVAIVSIDDVEKTLETAEKAGEPGIVIGKVV